jgi:hypothetical protein
MSAEHHVEAYFEGPGVLVYGWQCFTCKAERDGFETFSDAEEAGIAHAHAEASA